MGYGAPQQLATLTAGANLAAKQFTVMKVSANGICTFADNSAGPLIGLLVNKPGNGGAACVCVGGTAKGLVGANVTLGTHVMADANGALTPAAANNTYVGVALETGIVTEIINVLVQPGWKAA